MNGDFEKRIFISTLTLEKRDGDESKNTLIRGHAAVFDKLSENLGGFREKIAVGAFDDVLSDDVRALFNHDANIILGRSSAKTLNVSVDPAGLSYEIDPPDTQGARDLIISIKRGDVRESSFAFHVEDDSWDEDEDGRMVRTIKKIKRLLDVSPVTYASYPDATVAMRRLDVWKKSVGLPAPNYESELRKLNLRLEAISS